MWHDVWESSDAAFKLFAVWGGGKVCPGSTTSLRGVDVVIAGRRTRLGGDCAGTAR